MLKGVVLLALLLAACGPGLPEPESPGARLYQRRCSGCHRLYAPGSMTAEMWRYQVGRMEAEFRRRGLPWLAPEEEAALLGWLTRHAGGH